MNKESILQHIFVGLIFVCLTAGAALAQTTAFSYQGRLTDAGSPANGAFQMQFKLFDALAAGTQIGATISDVAVTASQGVFSTRLDFGANALSGENRFLEIGVRRNSGESYTTLAPREQIASSPYAVRTLSAQQADVALDSQRLGGVVASEYVTNATLSTNFIRNQTAQQANSNFNISGNGTVGGSLTVNAAFPNGLFLTNGAANLRGTIVGNTALFGTTSNNPLSLSANNGVNGNLFLDTTGNIGINTGAPNHKLTIDTNGGPTWTNDGWGGAIALRNSSALGWQLNSSSQSFGIGQSTGGLSFFRTSNSPGTSGNAPTYDMVISNAGNVGIGTPAPNAKLFVQGEAANGVGIAVTGNASQSLNKGGWVKAMVYVNGDGTLLRCYNGQTGSSTGNCGFATSRGVFPSGSYLVNFGFTINDRFYAISVQGGLPNAGVAFNVQNQTTLIIATFQPDIPSNLSDRPFMVIVY